MDFNESEIMALRRKYRGRPKEEYPIELILWEVSNKPFNLEYLPQKWATKREVAIEALKHDKYAYKVVDPSLKNDEEIKSYGRAAAIAIVSDNGHALINLSEWKNDKEVVLAAVKNNGWALNYASDELKNDKDVVIEAVKNKGSALQFASSNMKKDKDIVLEAVKNEGWALKCAKDYQDDKTIVLEAVKSDGLSLEFASPRLRGYKEDDKECRDVVLAAVKNNGLALKFASPNLQNNKEIVLEAVKNNGDALHFASAELKDDKEVVLEAVKSNGHALEDASERLQNDPDVLLEAAKNGFLAEYRKFDEEGKEIIQRLDIEIGEKEATIEKAEALVRKLQIRNNSKTGPDGH